MFGTGMGFGSLHRGLDDKKTQAEFDSATASDLKDTVDELTGAQDREQRSLVEQFREKGLLVVSGLIEAVTGENLDDGELPSDALDGLLLEAIDGIDDEEDDTAWQLLIGAVQDALETLGVDESVLAEMFGDDVAIADSAIESACETALANMPDDGEPLDEFVREFVYGEPDEDEVGFDSAISKAKAGRMNKARVGSFTAKKVKGKKIMYKGAWAVRKGVKKIVNKRLPNQKVRLSSAQKGAIKKARLKSQSANAIKMRVKSFKKGKKLGLY